MGAGRDMTQIRAQADTAPTLSAPQRFVSTVLRVDQLAPDVIGLVMAPPANLRFSYRPGQYLSVLLADGQRRSFSMASAWGLGRPIELHVRQRPGGCFTDAVLSALQVGDQLQCEGPFGHVDWREGTGPAILMGTGTGLAPLKALIEHALAAGGQRPIHLYWGGRAPADLYLKAHFHHLAAYHTRLRFIPVLSRPPADWAGRRGYVQDAVAEDFANLHDADLYACGSPTMITAARERLADRSGFDEDRFVADAFEPAAPVPHSADLPSISLLVNFRGAIRLVRAAQGASLLSALQAACVPILSVCGGKAVCGACKISLMPEWADKLPPPQKREQRLLAHLKAVPGERLSCQITLTAELAGIEVCDPIDPKQKENESWHQSSS
jgi:CDP-4-dehydro-6-deoxyglucose reductase, E3